MCAKDEDPFQALVSVHTSAEMLYTFDKRNKSGYGEVKDPEP